MMNRKQLLMTISPLIVLLAVCACMLLPFFFPTIKPLDQQLTVDALHNITQEQPTLAKIGSKYYASTPSLMFCSYFYFGSWELMDEVREGTSVITLEFGEKWVMELFEDSLGSYATVYNGNAAFWPRGAATYRIPLNVIELLTHYFENYAAARYWGDGTIGPHSFSH